MEDQPESLLKELGLSEYETKACMVLVRMGSSDANKIASAGGIPLPRVYDTMESLAKRGLVSISKTRPQKFSIINLKKFFEILKLDEKKKIDEKIRSIDDISFRFLKTVSEMPSTKEEDLTDETKLTMAKRSINVEEMWDQLQRETKSEFLVFAGDISWIDLRAPEIKKLKNRKASYKILWFKCIKEVVPNVRKALRAGAELRCIDEPQNQLRGIVSDSSKTFIIQKLLKPVAQPMPGESKMWVNDEFANYTGTLVSSRVIANVFRGYFYSLWQKAKPAEKFLKEIG